MSCPDPFFLKGSTNEFYHQVTDERTGDPVTTATITVNVLTAAGTPFLGTYTGVHIATGKYSVVINATDAATFVDGTEYIYQSSTVDGTNIKLDRITGTAGYSEG